MLGFIKKYFNKKNKNKMNTERLISLKEHFTGQRFQWIKTPKQELLGKVVKCRDIEPKGRGFMAIFNDGSTISTDLLNRNLMMITDGMNPLTKAEVLSINGPQVPPSTQAQTGPTGSGPIQMPDELKQFQTPPSERKVNPVETNVKSATPTSTPKGPKEEDTSNMFSMFNAEETNLNVNVNIKLPNKKLLKMMYENADDKEKFLLDLSKYVYSKINNNIVRESLEKTLVPTQRRKATVKPASSEVVVTEIKEDNE